MRGASNDRLAPHTLSGCSSLVSGAVCQRFVEACQMQEVPQQLYGLWSPLSLHLGRSACRTRRSTFVRALLQVEAPCLLRSLLRRLRVHESGHVVLFCFVYARIVGIRLVCMVGLQAVVHVLALGALAFLVCDDTGRAWRRGTGIRLNVLDLPPLFR